MAVFNASCLLSILAGGSSSKSIACLGAPRAGQENAGPELSEFEGAAAGGKAKRRRKKRPRAGEEPSEERTVVPPPAGDAAVGSARKGSGPNGKYLPKDLLSAKERKRASANAPLDEGGSPYCWWHNTHEGRHLPPKGDQAALAKEAKGEVVVHCLHSHKQIPAKVVLDWTILANMACKGGVREA